MIKYSILVALLALIVVQSLAQEECLSRDYGHDGTVCVCNADHCDTLQRPEPVEQPQYIIYTSNKAGLRFNREIGEFGTTASAENQIQISRGQKYQTIIGFGGSFTDSTGININSLDQSVGDRLKRSYFAEDGIEYNLGRVPIGGTDFSTHGYSYNDGDEDLDLVNFALAEEDRLYKMPLIKEAFELTNNNMQLVASAWTAPKWMKTNGEYAGYGFLKQEMYQSWVNYFIKFLDSYEAEGIPFWGLTTGNEPNTARVTGNLINIVAWNASDLGIWILDHLGPTLRNSSHSDIKLMTLDDQRMFLTAFVENTLFNDAVKEYIDGIAVHFYTDLIISPSRLDETHDLYPDKFILSTEASCAAPTFSPAVVLGSWSRGEFYADDIIQDLQHWVTGWVDWNMVLDLSGGPTYIENFVDAPVIVNATAEEFYKQPMFYVMGHFSKFIPRDSVRIESTTNLDYLVMVVAFQKPDNGTVVVILNKKEEVVPFSLIDEERGITQLELSEKSITTILYW